MLQNNNSSKVIEAVVVPDGKVDSDATRNLPEIEALVKRLYEIVVEDERKNPENPVSIGIISPFRAQVEQLKISASFNIKVSTLNRFAKKSCFVEKEKQISNHHLERVAETNKIKL